MAISTWITIFNLLKLIMLRLMCRREIILRRNCHISFNIGQSICCLLWWDWISLCGRTAAYSTWHCSHCDVLYVVGTLYHVNIFCNNAWLTLPHLLPNACWDRLPQLCKWQVDIDRGWNILIQFKYSAKMRQKKTKQLLIGMKQQCRQCKNRDHLKYDFFHS